jgi:hypothetical protein
MSFNSTIKWFNEPSPMINFSWIWKKIVKLVVHIRISVQIKITTSTSICKIPLSKKDSMRMEGFGPM